MIGDTDLTDYVIIGNGPAGIRAAETIREHDLDSRIRVISEESHLYYYRRLLSRFIAGRYKPQNLRVYPPDFYEKKGIEQTLGRTVEKIVPSEKQVLLDNNEKISYDKLLLAVGGKPIAPNWPGSTLKGVMTIRTLDDAQKTMDYIATTKEAVVVGGGLLGLNLAQSLRERGLNVKLLVRGNRLWPAMLDQKASEIIVSRLELEGIEVNFSTQVESIVGESDSASKVLTTGKNEIPCELIIVSIGIRPSVDFLKGSEIRIDKGVIVNQEMRTNIEDIYAAGDVAQAYDVAYKEYRVNTSWSNAIEQGTIAGLNMSGKHETFCGGVCSNTEKIYDVALTSIGVTYPPSADYEILIHNNENVYRKFVLKEDKVVGALLVGYTRDADKIEKLIRTEASVKNLGDKLLTGLA